MARCGAGLTDIDGWLQEIYCQIKDIERKIKPPYIGVPFKVTAAWTALKGQLKGDASLDERQTESANAYVELGWDFVNCRRNSLEVSSMKNRGV